MIRAIAYVVHPAAYSQAHSLHLIDDGCFTSILWSTFFESASLAWNAVWYVICPLSSVLCPLSFVLCVFLPCVITCAGVVR